MKQIAGPRRYQKFLHLAISSLDMGRIFSFAAGKRGATTFKILMQEHGPAPDPALSWEPPRLSGHFHYQTITLVFTFTAQAIDWNEVVPCLPPLVVVQ